MAREMGRSGIARFICRSVGFLLLGASAFLMLNLNNLHSPDEADASGGNSAVILYVTASALASCSQSISSVANGDGNTPSVTEVQASGRMEFNSISLTATLLQGYAGTPTWNSSYYVDYLAGGSTAELQSSLKDVLTVSGGKATFTGDLDLYVTPVDAGDVQRTTSNPGQSAIDSNTTPVTTTGQRFTEKRSGSTVYLVTAIRVGITSAAASGKADFGVACVI